MYFFANKTSVSTSRQWQTLLLAWREHDGSLTWWWQDNRHSANGNLLFLGKASFSRSQRCLQTIYFFFPHHYSLAVAINKSPAVYILSPGLDGLWRENRGSVNRLLTLAFYFFLGWQFLGGGDKGRGQMPHPLWSSLTNNAAISL